MAASINDKFTAATNSSRPAATTLSSNHTGGDTTINCVALTGWPTNTAVHFIMYNLDANGNKIAGSQTDWKGVVSGVTITNMQLKAGTDSGYTVGAVVECAPTAYCAKDLSDGLLVAHNQDGTHATNMVLTSPNLSTAINDSNGNELIKSIATSSAVNEITVTNATTTGSPKISATGDDTNISLNLSGKGTGTVNINNFKIFNRYDYVANGCVWTADSPGSTRVASMTAGTVVINGIPISVGVVTSRTFTASKDTYVDIDSTGTISYTEVANNVISPALAANSIRLAIVVTGASNIANAYSINQGKLTATTTGYLPNTAITNWIAPNSSVNVDGNGNLICPRDPERRLVSSYARAAASTTGSPGGTSVAWNGMNYIVFNSEANTNYKFTMVEPVLSGWTASSEYWVWPVYLGTTAGAKTTQLNDLHWGASNSSPTGVYLSTVFNSGTYSGKTFLSIWFRNAGFSGTMNINSDSGRTGIYTIERI